MKNQTQIFEAELQLGDAKEKNDIQEPKLSQNDNVVNPLKSRLIYTQNYYK